MSSYEMSGARSTTRAPRWVTIGAVAYSVVWVVGLLVWSSNLSVTASAGQVAVAYRGHETAAVVQSTLVHGLAGLALAAVVRALVAAVRAGGAASWVRGVATSGYAAVAVSVIQWVLGCALAAWAVPAGHDDAAGALYTGIDRLDGVKMAALAVLAALGSLAAARYRVLPRWLTILGAVLTVALVASAVAYLFASAELAVAAYVSLPLLLIWVIGAGLSLARRDR